MIDAREVLDACTTFRNRGWLPGGLGGVAQFYRVSNDSYKVYISPDNFNKNTKINDLFLLRSLGGIVDVQTPLARNQLKPPKICKWHKSFLKIIAKRSAKSVAQLFLKWDALAARKALYTWKEGSNNHPNVFRVAHWDLVPRLCSDSESTELLLPIIDYNEQSLQQVETALDLYPNCCAILIRDYGVILWSDSIDDLADRAEILEHLLELQIREHAI